MILAYKPSEKVKHGFEETRLNIAPVMNLMVVLIPLLLSSAEFVRLSVIELNLPPAALGPEGEQLNNLPEEEQRKLDLTVTITDRGFFISSAMAVLGGEKEGEPTIPLSGDMYDFEALAEKLYEIKTKAGDRFTDSEHIIIMAEPEIDYQTIVSTMDASRSIRINGENQALFPIVSLSAGIL